MSKVANSTGSLLQHIVQAIELERIGRPSAPSVYAVVGATSPMPRRWPHGRALDLVNGVVDVLPGACKEALGYAQTVAAEAKVVAALAEMLEWRTSRRR